MRYARFRATAVYVALSVCTCAGLAHADPIATFSTSGAFGLGTLTGNPDITASVTDGGTRLGIGDPDSGINTFLVYHAQQYTLDLGAAAQVDGWSRSSLTFGYFTLESTDPNGSLTYEKYREFDGAEFRLTVNQISPTVGDGTWVSKLIHGTVWYSEAPNAPGTSSYLGLKFADPLAFSIPGGDPRAPGTITYTIDPTVYMSNPGGQIGQQFGVGGSVQTVAAPLPGVAMVGLTLLSGVGCVRALKRNQAA